MSHFEELVQCPYNRSHRILPHAMQRHLFKCRKNNPSTKLISCPFNTIHRVPGPELKIHIDNCDDRATFDLYKYCISSFSSNKSKDYKEEEPELVYHHVNPAEAPHRTFNQADECWDNSKIPTCTQRQHCNSLEVIGTATSKKPPKQQFEEQANMLEKTKNSIIHDNPSFMGYRGSVPESKYYNRKSLGAPGKTLQDDDECWDDFNVPAYNPQDYCKNARVIRKATLMKPSKKKEFYYQENQRLKAFDQMKSHPVNYDIDEMSSKFTRSMNIKCK